MCSPTPCRGRGGPHAPPVPVHPLARAAAPCRGRLPNKARHRAAVAHHGMPLAEARPRRTPPGLGPDRGTLSWPRPLLGASRGRPIPLSSVLCVACPSPACRGPSPSCRGALFVPSALGHRRARSARAVRAGCQRCGRRRASHYTCSCVSSWVGDKVRPLKDTYTSLCKRSGASRLRKSV